jgi:dTDP-4-dehydrorhamnose reductase
MPDRNKILILGGSSYVGRKLFEKLGSGRAIATYNNTPLSGGIRFDSLSMRLSEIVYKPETISHAIILLGDTNPETCAVDLSKSQALNVESIKKVIRDLNAWQIKPVFTSSEFVFNGVKGDYVETDPVNPILLYGKQKVEIEEYLQETCGDYCILRLAKVFGAESGDGTLFTSWLNAIEQGQTIRCATDQIFSPIYREDVVNVLIRVTEMTCSGIFHLAGPKPFTRMELLEMLLKHVKVYADVKVDVVPCSILDFNLKEKRPLNVSMVPKKLENAINYKIGDVEDVCEYIVKQKYRNV